MFVNFNILNQLGSPAINSNTFANRPAAGQTGRLFVSTDTYEIYRDNGTTWDLIGGPGSSTITGTGTATQVAYFTSSQAIGSSANLFWDNTSGFLGVATATPSARIEAVKTDGVGIYANFTTNAGSGSSTTALWAKNVTNSSGFAAVIEETTPNATAGQYPLLIKHSLSSGTAGVGMGTGIHWQLPDDAGTFKTTQLTIETINAAAATYATRYRFNVQNNGSSTPVAYINATGLGIFTATPGAALDIHSTGIIAQLNSTSATANSLLAFQRSGSGLWRIGDSYNGGNNYFELHNTVLTNNAIEINAATNKSIFTALETYSTGLARGNYFDYNLSVAAGGSFSSPNAITALGASLDLTLAGNATIPSGARSGLDAYNSIAFTGAGTLTHSQGTQIRAYSNVTAGWAFNGSAVGTITHLAGLRALFPDNSGSAVNVTNNYALLLNDQTANTGTVTYTNRWGIYQEGTSDLNYFAGNVLIGTTTNNGNQLQVSGNVSALSNLTIGKTTQTSTLLTLIPSGSARSWQISANNYVSGAFEITPSTTNGGSTYTTPALVITNASLVGIGTNTPLAPLHVQGSAALMERTTTNTGGLRSTLQVRANSTGSTTDGFGPQLIFQITDAESTGAELASIGALRAGADNTGDLTFYTNAAGVSAERARITSAGFTGFGTSNPLGIVDASYGGYLAAQKKALVIGANISANTARTANTRKLGTMAGVHYDNGTEVALLRYDSDLTATELLIGGTAELRGATQIQIYTASTITAAPSEKARFLANGNFLIGTTTDPGQKLVVAGDIRLETGANDSKILFKNNVSANVRAISYNLADGSISFNSTSGAQAAIFYNSGDAQITGSFRTGAPSGGTSAAWKLGSRVAATVVLDTTQYIELQVGATTYKLAIVT